MSNRRRLKPSRLARPEPGGEDPNRAPLASAIAEDAARMRRDDPVGYRRLQLILRVVLAAAVVGILILAALTGSTRYVPILLGSAKRTGSLGEGGDRHHRRRRRFVTE
jgi:hypothetical protein